MSTRRKFKKRDIILLVILLFIIILSFIFLINRKPGKTVRVSYNNEIIDEFNLNESITKEYEYGEDINVLVIENNEAQIIEANCDNQICVNSKAISEVGETIACLPHKMIVEVIED